ncbi:MAG TPA: MCE family protein [Candidatus Cloacimonetes bacterium]|nr:MCE family protein [Candidatus Cloacimonadota bacterium]
MKTKKSELIVGIIIVLAVLIVVFGNIVITGRKQKSDMTEITVQFPQIGGLDVGNTVFVHGVRAGKVADIALEQNGVKVVLLVNKEIILKKDVRIIISERGMMGEREISIDPGSSSENLNTSQIIQGYYNVGFNETISQIGVTIKNINALSGTLGELIDDKGQMRTIKDIIQNLNALLLNINHIFEKNRDISIEFERINNILTNLDILISNNDEKVDRIITFADDKVSEIDNMLGQMQGLINKIEKEDTNLGRFTANDSLYQKINTTIVRFDSLVTDIRENPRHYFRLF